MKLQDRSVAFKMAVLIVGLVTVTFAGFVWLTTAATAGAMEESSVTTLGQRTRMAVDMIDAYDQSLRASAQRFAGAFVSRYPGGLAIDPAAREQVGGADVPVLTHGGRPVSADVAEVDRFSAGSGVAATLFVKSGDDLVRVVTSLVKEDGSRAVGTTLDRALPAYRELAAGRAFTGKVRLFGKDMMAAYVPLRGASGALIGAAFVGLDCTEALALLRARLREIRIGKTGYLYVLDASPGAARGTLIVHPAKEGQNILGARDADGREFIREILDRGDGLIRYPWMNAELGDPEPAEKVVSFATYAPWGWVVAAGTRTDEFTQGARDLRLRVMLLCAAAVVVLCAVTLASLRRLVLEPLRRAVGVARRIASGDLTGRIEVEGADETGQLMGALAEMNAALFAMMSDMRTAASRVTASAVEIASGSAEIADDSARISSRTEQQVAAIGDASGSMSSLTESVRESARDAVAASDLSVQACEVAERGGAAARELSATMETIRASSEKITGIIEMIDGIAFQTSILALNASVEAARAGQHGRGFAVVATSIQDLAARSKEAAREIAGLVTDSVVKVREGAATASVAGTRMTEAQEAARRVTELVARISGASQRQSEEIQRIGRTVRSLDETARENAEIAAETAASAAALQDQAGGLTSSVAALRAA